MTQRRSSSYREAMGNGQRPWCRYSTISNLNFTSLVHLVHISTLSTLHYLENWGSWAWSNIQHPLVLLATKIWQLRWRKLSHKSWLFFFASLYLMPNKIDASIFAGWRKFSLKIWFSDLLAITFNLKLSNTDTIIYAGFISLRWSFKWLCDY